MIWVFSDLKFISSDFVSDFAIRISDLGFVCSNVSLMAWQRARTGDFFIEIDIFGVARKLFYDAIEFVGQYRRRRFAGDLLIVFGKLGIGIGIGDRVPQCANPLRRCARRRDKGRGGNSERPIDLEQPSIFIGPGKGFELREMSEARMRAGFGDLQDRVNVDQFLSIHSALRCNNAGTLFTLASSSPRMTA